MMKNKSYLGDSVYVAPWERGVILTTENGAHADPSNRIFLNPGVLEALLSWLKARSLMDGRPSAPGRGRSAWEESGE